MLNGKRINIKKNPNNTKYENISVEKTRPNKTLKLNKLKYKRRENNINILKNPGAKKMDINCNLSLNKCNNNKINLLNNIIIIIIIFHFLIGNCNSVNLLFQSNEITLKINETGFIKILSDEFFFNRSKPSEIFINNNSQNEINNEYYFNNSETNIVKIIWNTTIYSTNNMFKLCNKIIEIDFSHFDTSNVRSMQYMFHNCTSLVSLDLSNFNTSKVKGMSKMFARCTSLISLNLSNFDTSNVTDMDKMFLGCSSLSSLNLTNFITSNVTDMSNMFYGCSSLNHLNLSNFNASNVNNMANMFFACNSLKTLDISNFDTSQVQDMTGMFGKCELLNELDLSNFNTSQVKNMSHMFYECESLNSLNLYNFDTENVEKMDYMFFRCSNLTSLNLSNFDTSKVKLMNDMFSQCKLLKLLDISNFNTSKVTNMSFIFNYCQNLVSLNLSNFDTSNVQYMEKMFFNCSSLTSLNLSNFNTSNVSEMKTMFSGCSLLSSLNLSNFDLSRITNLDEIFNNCYNLEFLIINLNNLNTDTTNFTKEIISSTQNLKICGDNDNNILFNLFRNKKIDNYIDSDFINKCYLVNDESAYNITKIIQNFNKYMIDRFDINEINNFIDKKVIYENKEIILTSTFNQRYSQNNITMEFEECERKLKNDNNISNNDSLYILQIISYEEKQTPKLDYEIYYPYNNNSLTKLNLASCIDRKIFISISAKIDGELDKYNPKSAYYNDICSKTTSKNRADLLLKDRRKEFVENNMSLCEENCDISQYDFSKEKVKCSCDVKLSLPSNYENKFDKIDFFKSFTDVKNIFNLNIMKCYKVVLKIKCLKNNYGFIIVSSIIILFFFSLFIFTCSYSKLKKEISRIVLALKINENIKKEKMNIEEGKKLTKNKKLPEKNLIKNKKYRVNNKLNLKNNKKMSSYKSLTTKNIKNSLIKKKEIKNISKTKDNTDIYNILSLKDFELNSLNYNEVLKSDHRNYCEYYISLLKYNHPFLFSFGCFNDYNSRIIKFFLFFFSFSLDLSINALFFTDDTMHKIYIDKGKFNFLYQIPQILYSTLISKFINTLIISLALSQAHITQLKKEKNKNDLDKNRNRLLKKLKIKFAFFFLLAFGFLLLIEYYITCFCGIYENTQIHLIKDTILSLIISLLIPFFIYLIPGIFRILSIKGKKNNRKLLYQFSLFLESMIV